MLGRRALCRTLGLSTLGVGLAPWLDLGAGLDASAASLSSSPTRLLVFFSPNGTIPEEFFPTGTEQEFRFGRMLAPLQRHAEDLLVLDGLSMGVTDIAPGDPHQKGMAAVLTGMPANEGNFCGGAHCENGRSGWASGPSIDQIIAGHVGAQTPFRSLELGVGLTGSTNRARLSYAGSDQPIAPINNPRDAYDLLFGEPSPSASREVVQDELLCTLSGMLAGASDHDRARLEAHMASLEAMQKRLSSSHDLSHDLEVPAQTPKDYPEHGELQLDIATAALSSDATRVASVCWSGATAKVLTDWLEGDSLPEASFDTPITKNFHEYTHEPYGDPDDSSQREVHNKLVTIYNYYAEAFAGLLDRLAAVQEPDGSRLLDSTIVLWCSELGSPDTHITDRMPFVVAGGRKVLQTGRLVRFEHEQHTALLATLVAAMGVEVERFGHPDYAREPIDHLLAFDRRAS